MKGSFLLVTLLLLVCVSCCEASRFRVNGPALTVTLKDPMESASGSSKWLDLKRLRPNLNMSIQSTAKPLPSLLPSLQGIQGNIGYQYEVMRRAPSVIEGTAKFRAKGIDLDIQPSYELRSKRSNLLVQLSKGAAFAMAQFSNTALVMIRGCYQKDFTSSSSISAIRVTPTWDVLRRTPSCLIEGTTGTQRTKAVLNVEARNPTLRIVHALSERHVIAPEISLANAKMVYQWNVDLDSGSILTKVDPTDSVHVTWVDYSRSGKWVTDFRLPLVGTTISALAADLRVRRQFSF